MSLADEINAIGPLQDFDADRKRRKKLIDDVVRLKSPEPTVDPVEDMRISAGFGLPNAAVGLAGMPRDMSEFRDALQKKYLPNAPDWLKKASNVVDNVNPINLLSHVTPGSEWYKKKFEDMTGLPWYRPQTRAGQIMDTGVQTAAAMGRNWITTPLKAAALTTAQTAGTEGAGALSRVVLKQNEDDPIWRILGGPLGGAIPAGVNAARSRAGAVVRDTLGDMTDAEIASGIQKQREAQQLGHPLIGTESLDKGHNLASTILASLGGGQILKDFFLKRPGQVETAVNKNLIAPTRNAGTPIENETVAQQTASNVVKDAEQGATNRAAPFYKATEGKQLPGQASRPIFNELVRLIMGGTYGGVREKQAKGWYNELFPHTASTLENPPTTISAPPPPNVARGVASVDASRDDIITAIRKLGGINPADEAVGSLAKANPFPPDPRYGPVWSAPRKETMMAQNRARSLDDMAARLREEGYPVHGPDDVMEAIANHTMGQPTYAHGYDFEIASLKRDPLLDLNETLAELTGVMKRQQAFRDAPKPTPPDPNFGVKALPETDVGRLIDFERSVRELGNTSTIGARPRDVLKAWPAQQLAPVVDTVLKQHSPEFRAGKAAFEDEMKNVVNPLKQGPVGRLAGETGFDPKKPVELGRSTALVSDAENLRPGDIKTLYSHLNAKDPRAFPGVVKTWIEKELDAALTDLRGGPPETAGSKFRQAMYGSPQQRQNFEEALRGVAEAHGVNGNELIEGTRRLMSVLERSGRTPGMGSPTATRQELKKEMSGSLAADVVEGATVSTRGFADRMRQWANRGRDRDLARILTDPDSVQKLVKMAKLRPNGLTMRYYVASMLGLDNLAGDLAGGSAPETP